MAHPDDYRQVMRRLAALDADAAGHREEAQQWYRERCAAADSAVADAVDAVDAAEAELVRAERATHDLNARAEHLWIEYVHHVGTAAERFGARLPEPGLPRPDDRREPEEFLHEVEAALAETPSARPFTGATRMLLVFFGVAGGAVAFAASQGLRWAAREAGGDLAVGLPVLALVVMLLGPLVGLAPTKILADRRHVGLDLASVARVVVAALVTAGLLYAVLR
jgi:hypothetical protein